MPQFLCAKDWRISILSPIFLVTLSCFWKGSHGRKADEGPLLCHLTSLLPPGLLARLLSGRRPGSLHPWQMLHRQAHFPWILRYRDQGPAFENTYAWDPTTHYGHACKQSPVPWLSWDPQILCTSRLGHTPFLFKAPVPIFSYIDPCLPNTGIQRYL